jgi:chemotaxis protein MotB
MSRRRSRAGASHGGGGHDGPDERWMASYMDMVTVLMCLFIVLYAMSTIDQTKFEKLKLALATGFGEVESTTVDTAEGFVVPPDLVGSDGEAGFRATPAGTSELEEAQAEAEKLQELQAAIDLRLTRRNIDGRVEYEIDERGLTIRLVGAETFFGGNSAELRPRTRQVVDAIGSQLDGIPNDIGVEGFADPRGPAAPYATDWELSAARATGVLRRFVENDHISGRRISATAYGSSQSSAKKSSALNRRVDIVVFSDKSESVRELIPGLLDGTLGVPPDAPPAEAASPPEAAEEAVADASVDGGTASETPANGGGDTTGSH